MVGARARLTDEVVIVAKVDEVLEERVEVGLLPKLAHLVEVRVVDVRVHTKQAPEDLAHGVHKVARERDAGGHRDLPPMLKIKQFWPDTDVRLARGVISLGRHARRTKKKT